MTLDDLINEHTDSVFLNLDHFAKPYTFESRAAAAVPFKGIFDNAKLMQQNTDEADAEQADATITVSYADAQLFAAAVPDFESDGWVTILGQRYSLTGELQNDGVLVVFALGLTNAKTFRRAYPSGLGRPTKHH
jgi:hypothetical protein